MSEPVPNPNTEIAYTFYVVVPHPREPRLLLLPAGEQWALPHFTPKERFFTMTGPLNEAAKQALGVDVTVLRCARYDADREVKKRVDAIFFMENHSPDWTPGEGMRWVGREELAGLELAVPEQRETLESWFSEAEGGEIPAQRAPWARPGWLDLVSGWMRGKLAERGLTVTGQVEQVKQWGISCVLKVATTGGDYYFKAVPGIFATEPQITEGLARLFPGRVPEPLAIEMRPGEGWMLLRGFETKPVWDATQGQWDAILRLFAPLQRASVDLIDQLYAVGCQDRRLDKLALHLDELLADEEMMSSLEEVQREQLRTLAPTLRGMCEKLAGYAIPYTLVHGDFHPANVVPDGGGYCIFDWTDACIAHPFLDMATVLESDGIQESQEARAHLRAVYLEEWARYGYEPPERLEEALRLALPLGALHQAVSYRNIVAALEPAQKWELASGRSYWVRIMLRDLLAEEPKV
jgi:hypothetical protein